MTWLINKFPNYEGNLNQNDPIKTVFIDSREKVNQGLFVPIQGERLDGHEFIEQAIDNGAIAILCDESKQVPEAVRQKAIFIYVQDTTLALQQLAHAYRNKINPIVVGITGSNGKTTTKDLVAAVVETSFQTHYTNGNYNNHIGLPLTILAMASNTEVLVLEMGMSDFGEIERLSQVANPDYAIITNIGESHIEFLGSRKGIVQAKLEIRAGMKEDGYLIIDGDEKSLQHLHNETNVITCGFNHTNQVMLDEVQLSGSSTFFQLNDQQYELPLLGKHHAKNAAYAITFGNLLKIDEITMKSALKHIQVTSMRFQFLTGKNNVTIINDAYNASPTSMMAAIEAVKSIDVFTNKVLVLGDIFELGERTEYFHRSIAEVIDDPISTVFTYGDAASAISEEVHKKNPEIACKHFMSREQLTEELNFYLNEDTILLFKASRGMEFEQFVREIV